MSVWLRTVSPSWTLRIPPASRLCALCSLCPFWELTLTANEEFDANFMLTLPLPQQEGRLAMAEIEKRLW